MKYLIPFVFRLVLIAITLAGCSNRNDDTSTVSTVPTVTGLSTEDTTPTITGTFDSTGAIGGLTVTVNSVTYTLGIGSELVNIGNNWFLTIPAGSELAVGTYDVVATATDGAANAVLDATTNELTINNDTTPPSVSSTSPTESATGVVRNTLVTATFDEDIFAATVDTSSFTLANGGNVTGAVTFDGLTNIATFTPDNNLSMLTSYNATLSTAITDLSGNPLASDYIWSFTSEDGAWGTEELIETDNAGRAESAQVAFDPSGNAITVWMQSDGTRYNIWANRYVAGTGWDTAELIENNDAGFAEYPQIAIDASGNAIAVWVQHDGTRKNTWANRYVVGTGWDTAELIETDNAGNAMRPQVAVDTSGNAIAIWVQNDGTRNNILGNHYTVGTGWGTAGYLEANAGNAGWPQIAIDGSGNAIAVWQQRDGTRDDIWGIHYTVGTGWGTAGLVETNNAGTARDPQVAFDTSGNAIVVWFQDDSARYNIWAKRYVAGTGWSTEELIEAENLGHAEYPQIAFDGSGNAIAVWDQHDGTQDNVWANRYVAGAGWGTAEMIETDTGNSYIPQIAVDDRGNGIAVWVSPDQGQSIRANRYVAGTGWGTAELIEASTDSAYGPQVAIDTNGNAIAVWEANNNVDPRNIWANRFE